MALIDESTDIADLAAYGYRQKLNRRLGSFSSFAAGFSFISILTGMFELFGFGYGFGGPAIWWTWLIVLAGQFAVALCFSELAARFPIAGSVYQWSKRLSSPGVAWMTGWMMLLGSIATIAAVAVALEIVLPSVWSGFQVFKSTTGNAVFLGCLLILATTIINAIGVRLMSMINNVGVMCELAGAVAIIVLLLFHVHRGPGVVVQTAGTGPGLPGFGALGYFAAFSMAAIMPAYVMYGFDTSCTLAEETRDPRRRSPRAVLQALGAAGIAGALLLLVALMASPTLNAGKLGIGGLPFIITSELGNTTGRILLADVAIAISVCTLAIQTATIRLTFSMARDNNLPFARSLARISDQQRSPIVPAVVSGVLAAGILVVNIGKAQIFLIVTSVAISFVYIAYFMVTGPMILRRLRGAWPPKNEDRQDLFSMGKLGLAVNVFALSYGVIMATNLLLPRSQIWGTGTFAYGGLIAIGGSLAVGLAYYFLHQRHQGGIIEEHRAETTGLTVAAAVAGGATPEGAYGREASELLD